jgi:hypothetical protein
MWTDYSFLVAYGVLGFWADYLKTYQRVLSFHFIDGKRRGQKFHFIHGHIDGVERLLLAAKVINTFAINLSTW